MSASQKLEAEILNQLEGDILSFGWLRQLAANNLNEDAVFDAAVALVDSGLVVVGDARSDQGVVIVGKWNEIGRDLKDKMRRRVSSAPESDRDFCFWLQLAKHHVLK
jgi:hypothetical protein